MATNTITYQGELVVHTCWCGIRHAIPAELDKHVRDSKGRVAFCPLGHQWVIRKSDADKLRAELDQMQADRDHWRTCHGRTTDALEHERRSNAALRGHLTRWRKRVANGVCPVAGCHRHFPNVQAHVETVHAEWLAEHPEVFTEAAT